MTRPDAPLDRRAFLTAAAGAGASAALGGFTNVFERWPPMPGAPSPTWPPQSASRAFEIVVIGDSIMWGQGMSDDPAKDQKFTFKVQRFIQQKMPGTEVHLHNFAHSGAQILANELEDAKPSTYGEIPNYFPSINWQLGRSISELAGTVLRQYVPRLHSPTGRESVALVLMDGGINDLGTKKILTPDPTILSNPTDPTSGAEWVRRATRVQCVERMRSLLPRVLTTFPNAKVVVTNYFQIVSDQSDPVYLWELLRLWDIIGPALTFLSPWMMMKLAAQSFAFHDEITKGLRTVVAEARPLEVIASAASSKVVRAGGMRGELGGMAAQPSRAALAAIPFGPENSYAAPDTNLFYLNEPDPAASVRKPKCLAQYGVLNPNCAMAAGGHPNLKGAEVYADTIIATLKRLVPEWALPPKLDPTLTDVQPITPKRTTRPPTRRP